MGPAIPVEEDLDLRASVGIQTIPHDDHISLDHSAQVPKKSDQVRAANVLLRIQGEIKTDASATWRNGHGCNGGHFLSRASRLTNDRRLAAKCPSAPDERREHIAGFINKGDDGIQFAGFF